MEGIAKILVPIGREVANFSLEVMTKRVEHDAMHISVRGQSGFDIFMLLIFVMALVIGLVALKSANERSRRLWIAILVVVALIVIAPLICGNHS